MPKVPDVTRSLEARERKKHEQRLRRVLARGDREIAAGVGFDLDSVLKEADAILAGDRRPG